MSYAEVNNYLTNEFKNIEGWCIPQLWNCMEPIMDYHCDIGLNKPIAEIGVYHGKFFLGLVKTVDSIGVSHAFDVFDMQQFNLDGAGKGSLDRVEINLNNCNVNPNSYQLNRVDSMTLNSINLSEMGVTQGMFSWFSVDGCHTPEHTINDTKIALHLTAPEGIIFVDDYYNAQWPGVQEGISKFYLNEYSNFIPLLYTCNKLFLCHISFHAIYLDMISTHLRENYKSTRTKLVKRFGYDSITVSPDYQSDAYLVKIDKQSIAA